MPKSRVKILIADDFATMRRMMKNVFLQLGFKDIEEAEDGIQALVKLKQNNFDLLVTDWEMPNLNGLSLLRFIRKDAALKHIPVLMVTVESRQEQVKSALQAGVNSYIIKPFTAEIFQKNIDRVLRIN